MCSIPLSQMLIYSAILKLEFIFKMLCVDYNLAHFFFFIIIAFKNLNITELLNVFLNPNILVIYG